MEIEQEIVNFLNSIKKVKDSRKHKVSNSLGVYDAYKFLRKRKWFDVGINLTEHQFYSIIRKVNNYLAESFLKGYDIKLPNRMGTIELKKYKPRFQFKNGKVKTNLPIDWDKTLKLWYEDEEAYKNKTLVKMEEKELFKVYYNKHSACYNNKTFYEFNLNRDLKKRLKQKIKRGEIDAFKISNYD